MILTREQIAAHRKTLDSSRGEPAMAAAVALARHDYEKTKEHMVDCEPEQFLTLQGQARGFKAILTYLTARSSPQV